MKNMIMTVMMVTMSMIGLARAADDFSSDFEEVMESQSGVRLMASEDPLAPQNACVPVKRKPSEAYLKKMKRLKELEKEVVELRKQVADKKETLVERTVEKETLHVQKNHLRLLGGAGITGTELSIIPGLASLSSTVGPVFGLAYGRNVSDRWSIELEVLTTAGLVGIGYNF